MQPYILAANSLLFNKHKLSSVTLGKYQLLQLLHPAGNFINLFTYIMLIEIWQLKDLQRPFA